MRLVAKVRTHVCDGVALLLLLVAASVAPAQQQWGSIKGQVVFSGDKIPAPAPLPAVHMSGDAKVCLGDKKELFSQNWIVDPKTKGVKWVYVWLILDSTDFKDWSKPIPIHPGLVNKKLPNVIVDQPCCQFEPYCLALQNGQSLTVKNSMTIAHNVKIDGSASDENPALNRIIPPGKEFVIGALHTTKGIGSIPVSCNIHPWMSGYIRVFSHPYFTVTKEDGKFEIKDAPAGKYRLVIWHPGAGWIGGEKHPGKFGTPIEIKANATTDLGSFKALLPKEEK